MTDGIYAHEIGHASMMYFKLSSQGALAFNFVRHQSQLLDRVGSSDHNSVGTGYLETHIKVPTTKGSGGILTPLLSTGFVERVAELHRACFPQCK